MDKIQAIENLTVFNKTGYEDFDNLIYYAYIIDEKTNDFPEGLFFISKYSLLDCASYQMNKLKEWLNTMHYFRGKNYRGVEYYEECKTKEELSHVKKCINDNISLLFVGFVYKIHEAEEFDRKHEFMVVNSLNVGDTPMNKFLKALTIDSLEIKKYSFDIEQNELVNIEKKTNEITKKIFDKYGKIDTKY